MVGKPLGGGEDAGCTGWARGRRGASQLEGGQGEVWGALGVGWERSGGALGAHGSGLAHTTFAPPGPTPPALPPPSPPFPCQAVLFPFAPPVPLLVFPRRRSEGLRLAKSPHLAEGKGMRARAWGASCAPAAEGGKERSLTPERTGSPHAAAGPDSEAPGRWPGGAEASASPGRPAAGGPGTDGGGSGLRGPACPGPRRERTIRTVGTAPLPAWS